MIFCPECKSRAIPIKEHGITTKYKCTREMCSKEFYRKN